MKLPPAAIAALLTTVLSGQQAEPPSFRASTTLVEFTFVALDNEKSAHEGTMQHQVADFSVPPGGDETAPIQHALKITPRRDTQKIRLLVRDRFTGRYGSLDIDPRAVR